MHPRLWRGDAYQERVGGSLWIMPKNTTTTTNVYLDIPKEKLEPSTTILGCDTFQQGGAPIHTAKIVKTWLSEKIKVLDWPGSSPDLNVIENCAMIRKKKVADKHPTSLEDLVKIKDVWMTEITPEYCENQVKSMPKRIQAVIKNKAYPTKTLSVSDLCLSLKRLKSCATKNQFCFHRIVIFPNIQNLTFLM